MVIFRSPDGKPGYHQAETLEEAVRFVERLRNDDEVTDARVFRMEEVPIEFKVYYRVEVGGAAEAPVDAAPEAVAEETVEEASGDPVMADANGAGAGPNGRFGLFTR